MAKFQQKHQATGGSYANHDLSETQDNGQINEEANIRPAIENLMAKEVENPREVREQIVKFFRAYDECKEDQVLRMQAKLDQEK